jgi:hypothetical protein
MSSIFFQRDTHTQDNCPGSVFELAMNIRRLVWFGEKLCAVNAAMLPRAASSSAGDPATWLPVSYSQPGPVQLDQLRLVRPTDMVLLNIQTATPPPPLPLLVETVAGSRRKMSPPPPSRCKKWLNHTSDISTVNLPLSCDLSLIEYLTDALVSLDLQVSMLRPQVFLRYFD